MSACTCAESGCRMWAAKSNPTCLRVQKANVASATPRLVRSSASRLFSARVNDSPHSRHVGAILDAFSPYDSNAEELAEMIDVPEGWPPRIPLIFACRRSSTGFDSPHTRH